MLLRSVLVITSFLVPALARAQDSVAETTTGAADATPDPSAKDLFAAFEGRLNAREFSDQKSAAKAIEELIAANKAAFASGDGLHYSGKLRLVAGDTEAALNDLKAHIETNPESALINESRAFAALCYMNKEDLDSAGAILDKLDESNLEPQTKGLAQSLKGAIGAERARSKMNGQAAPEIVASDVVNGDAGFTLSGQKGKVTVVDFFATWCPPCRAVVPELVELQAQHANDGVQVVGVTQYYGYGMDFSDPTATKPHGGKRVGGRGADALSHEVELEVNKTFAKAFEMNYPIVFADPKVIGEQYGVQGIPTVFVIDKDGNIVGSVVGGGEENHHKILAMIEKALGGGAASDKGAKEKHGGK